MNLMDNYDFKGRKVLMRVDFNVPLNEKGEILDHTRIVTAIIATARCNNNSPTLWDAVSP